MTSAAAGSDGVAFSMQKAMKTILSALRVMGLAGTEPERYELPEASTSPALLGSRRLGEGG